MLAPLLLLLCTPVAVFSRHIDSRVVHKHSRVHRHLHQNHTPEQTDHTLWSVENSASSGEVVARMIQDAVADTAANTGKHHHSPRNHQDLHNKRDTRPLRVTPSATSTATTTVKVITSAVPTGTVQILPSPSGQQPDTTGSVHTSLETTGRSSVQPILTSKISSATSLLTPTTTMLSSIFTTTAPAASTNIFAAPIGTAAPPSQIKSRKDHPVARLGVTQSAPISTNKFYANFFLGAQTSPSFLHPYSVAWAKGTGASGSYGLSISHIEATQRVYGPAGINGAVSYYLNPIGIQSLVISAAELGADTVLTTDQLTAYSARVSLAANASATPAVRFPLVQGLAFITAQYTGATPLIQTGVFFRTVTRATKEPKAGITKYKFTLEDGTLWYLYAYHTSGVALDLQVVNNGLAQAKSPFYGIIQITKDPQGKGETLYDQACGAYPTGVELVGTVNGAKGTYSFNYQKGGMASAKLVMMALPHHVSSFDDATRKGVNSAVTLQTTTKGLATAVLADSWTMVESSMPVAMGFAPWSATLGTRTKISDATKALIRTKAQQEISQNITLQTDQNSMYFGGKALAKFAALIYTMNDLLGDKALAATALGQLKVAFNQFATNQQQYPLVYESAWGGVVSSASYVTGSSGADFGNSYYNDHHFHYGYFIYAAAVIGYLDPTWVKTNKDYVNMLVRDISNPSSKDPYFPVHRAFDWFHGHSWAHGLFDTLDGKDQESSSEDVMHAYAIKMWGQTVGDSNMAARGNLQLSILSRSLKNYYLYTSSNTVQPAKFIGNRVAGILFENKIDHTTYFGTNIEYIQGIHMIPLLPCTPLVRSAEFVSQEWSDFFSNGRADQVVGGWKGILYGNLATIDPKAAYQFFSGATFDSSWLDGGASLTWYLAYAAAMGGL